MAKIINAIQKAYQRERNRILSQIRKLKKQGYDTSDIKIPKIPKKKTEGSVRRLEKLSTRKIQEQASRVDVETGEIITARQAKVRAIRERGEARKSLAPVSQPKQTQEPLPQADKPLDAWNYAVDQIEEQIEQIPHKPIHYQKPPSEKKRAKDINYIYTNVSNAFKDFLYHVEKDAKKKEEAIVILNSILEDEWLVATAYDSGDILRSKYVNYLMFADAINSTLLKESLTNMPEEDLTEYEDTWYEAAENVFNVMDYL